MGLTRYFIITGHLYHQAIILMTITPLYYVLYFFIILMTIIASIFVVRKPITKSVILSVLFIYIFSLGLYQFVGNPEGYKNYLYTTQINQLISEIQAHLKSYPSSREGWYLLG